MTAGHAELSGSTSGRWMRCPGSVGMIKSVSGEGRGSNQYGREGTFAHAVAAHILNGNDIPPPDSEFVFEDHGEEVTGIVTDEMLEHVMFYVNHIRSHEAEGILFVEQHVDLSSFVRDAMWGTSDAIIVKPDELVVSDFKYGYYPVHLVDYDLLLEGGELNHINSQLLYYAAGAANQTAVPWEHPKITLEIVQPRCMEVPDVQSVTITSEALKRWATQDLWKAAHLATSQDAPLIAGEWCRFCPALAICPAVRHQVQTAAAEDFANMDVTPIEVPESSKKIVEILKWAPIIDAWLRACEEHALQLMNRGVKIPGFKLVQKRANRCWPADITHREIFNKLVAAGGAGTFKDFITTDFLSPAKAEKIAGKKAVNAVCEHPTGDLTVAAESDKRPAVDPTPDFEEFQ